ncbi:hypothetical protein CP979_27220 [Streptomyces filamentosus]|nr:hypothetical protein CP979_27220 [Streptomyces filamentosus]
MPVHRWFRSSLIMDLTNVKASSERVFQVWSPVSRWSMAKKAPTSMWCSVAFQVRSTSPLPSSAAGVGGLGGMDMAPGCVRSGTPFIQSEPAVAEPRLLYDGVLMMPSACAEVAAGGVSDVRTTAVDSRVPAVALRLRLFALSSKNGAYRARRPGNHSDPGVERRRRSRTSGGIRCRQVNDRPMRNSA